MRRGFAIYCLFVLCVAAAWAVGYATGKAEVESEIFHVHQRGVQAIESMAAQQKRDRELIDTLLRVKP